MISLSTLTGLGGMAFSFSRIVRAQAEEQVRGSLDGKVNAIAAVTETAEMLAYGLGVSATTLHERRAQYPDTYREIVLQLFERRPEFVIGLGLGQSENGLIVDQPWLFPYYSLITSQEDTSFDQDFIIYDDLADNKGEFYPESQRYQQYFMPQSSVWTEPYQRRNRSMLTYYLPMFGKEGNWLGTILVDIDGKYLSNLLNEPVFRQAGHFVLATKTGTIITDLPNSDHQLKTYQDVPELNTLWPQIDFDDNGFLRGTTGYWAHATVPGQDWVLLGFVPYTVVYNRILILTVSITAFVMGLLLLVLYFAVGKLNRHLKPILLQCNQLPEIDHQVLTSWSQQDELNQLSLGFFKILEQLNNHEDSICHYKQALTEERRHTSRVVEQFLEFANRIDEEADEQQSLIQVVQMWLADHNYQSVDIHLDALLTMTQGLTGELKQISSDIDSSELLAKMEQHMVELTEVLDKKIDESNQPQLQAVIDQLWTDVAMFRLYDQGQPSLKDLQYQASSISHAGQAAMDNSRRMLGTSQRIHEALMKIGAIANNLNRQVKFASNILWTGLEKRKELIKQQERATADTVISNPASNFES